VRVAAAALAVGMDVAAVETDPVRRDALRRAEYAGSGKLEVAGSSDARACVATLVCVPTRGDDGGFDPRALFGALDEVGRHLSAGELVAIESTVSPGTTDGVLRQALERASCRRVGEDVFLAHVPERFYSTIAEAYHTIPRIVGGVTPACTAAGIAFYRELVDDVHPVSSAHVAELSKVFENAFRFVNVALVNEFALAALRLGVDPQEVIAAASTKHRGFMPFWPSAGAGGHCVPASTRLLAAAMESSGGSAALVSAALAADAQMPEAIASALDLSTGMRVLLMGAGYKSGAARTTESPSLRLARHLRTADVDVEICDGHLSANDVPAGVRIRRPLEVTGRYEVVMICAREPEFEPALARLEAARIVDLSGSAALEKKVGGASVLVDHSVPQFTTVPSG
jgi:nucleotide sugar dehydrogenase